MWTISEREQHPDWTPVKFAINEDAIAEGVFVAEVLMPFPPRVGETIQVGSTAYEIEGVRHYVNVSRDTEDSEYSCRFEKFAETYVFVRELY